jgi:competence protein ComEC
VVNIFSAPIISIISIGGMISALAALIWPMAGSALAWLLYYPTHNNCTRAIFRSFTRKFCCRWYDLGSTVKRPLRTDVLGVAPVLVATALVVSRFLGNWFSVDSSLVIPSDAVSRNRAGSPSPVLVIQDKGKVVLVNSGDANTAVSQCYRFTTARRESD